MRAQPSNSTGRTAGRLLTRRGILRAAASALAISAGIGAYTRYVEPFWVEFVHRTLALPLLPAELAGLRLMQVSDLHVGKSDPVFLDRALRMARDLHPDLLVLTGDFTSHRSAPAAARNVAKTLRALGIGRLGTFACLGNHDYGFSWSDERCADAVTSALTDSGVRVLRNEVAYVRGLRIVGIEDLWSPRFESNAARQVIGGATGPTIVLAHNPDTCDRPIWGDFRGWILAGHTHGGQCKPPFLPPPMLPVQNRQYTAGEFTVSQGRSLYINRALGYIRQLRFNVRPEVTVFTLSAA